MLRKHGADPRAHTDQAMQALIKETEKMMSIVQGDDLRDAAIIASVQKIEHYEIGDLRHGRCFGGTARPA
jgi:ferritin-like metal-binding protein YciE